MITLKRGEHPNAGQGAKSDEADLIARGFTPLKDEPTPFDRPQWHQEKPQLTKAQKEGLQPFTSWYATRDYRKIYRAVFDFHKRNNPPPQRGNGRSDEYWSRVQTDMMQTLESFGGDPLLTDLLTAVYTELERESEGIPAK